MKHLPTETVLQVIGHLSKPDLMSVALISSRYSILARPFLFKRIRFQFKSKQLPYYVRHIGEYPDHALMIKIIEIGAHWRVVFPDGFQDLFRAAVTLEELWILERNRFPLEELDPAPFSNLRRLVIISWADYARLAADFFPQCPKLVDLEVSKFLCSPFARTDKLTSALQQHAPSFMNRLRRFRGPPYFLHYMPRTGRALQHFSSTLWHTDEWPSYISKEMGFGEELLSLHIIMSDHDSVSPSRAEKLCFSPSITPSLFPNLRSVAWFRVHHLLSEWQPDESHDSSAMGPPGLLVSPNAALLAALKQLPHLRRVYLVSLHRSHDGPFPEVITAFITDLQKEAEAALPHLMSISIWAVGPEPSSYTWKRGYIDSDDGKTHLSWISATDEIINPDASIS